MSNDWCTIESDPGVFTSLIEKFGVKGAEVTELWSMDDDSLIQLGQVYGFIFLFKWESEKSGSSTGKSSDDGSASATSSSRVPLNEDDIPSNLFFARQTITNACATQAILSILLNASSTNLTLGPVLEQLKGFTSDFSSEMKGEAIGSSEEIRVSHNSFAANDPFFSVERKRKRTETGDVFHFIAYVPIDGKVYELDGLQSGPILIGECKNESSESNVTHEWLSIARTAIQTRIEQYSTNEIKFNLMAIIQDKRMALEEQLAAVATTSDNAAASSDIQFHLHQEEDKRHQWTLENQRRQHNYLPFCYELIKAFLKMKEEKDKKETTDKSKTTT